ncbi:hypothetical protein DOJK_02393 [Patescibacteria group bacterium]|nr:hypothetical protein DOJK_02393 [Patescibacteria group bacterium]
MNSFISRFLSTASVFAISLMLSGCAKDFALFGNDGSQTQAVTNETPSVSKKPPVADPGPLNSVAQAVQKAGVSDCLARINQVSTFLTNGSQQSGVSLSLSPQVPNDHISSLSFEIKSPQVLSYASADFAPTVSGCGASYEAITHWQNNCKDVATKGYAQLKFIGAIQSNILVLEGGPQLKVYLMPAGKGCVAIKKEVVF